MNHMRESRNTWLRWTARGAAITVMLAYVGSYAWLSRIRIAEAEARSLDAFLYVPIDKVMLTHDLTTHHRLTFFYKPLNTIDQYVFGAMDPIGSIMFALH